ncbi:MAG: hypothetical protein NW215_00975 [Hyphomicrobiales bacterium]|nr:hypothetical protein [Hyphomicrobiales bacterium]
MKAVCGALLAFLSFVGAAAAQAEGPGAMADAHVRRALMLVLKQIHLAQCGDGKRCEPATSEEYDTPPIPLAVARRIIQTGVSSGAAQWCGIDWQATIFVPMMSRLREGENWSDRQLAIAALMHGVYQGQTYGPLLARGKCDDETRARVAASAPDWNKPLS